MDSQAYIYIALCALGAGLLHSTAGFGGPMFLMIFFPSFLPVTTAAGMATAICTGEILVLAVQYHKHIQWKAVLAPLILYVSCSVPMILISKSTQILNLKLLFSIVLIFFGAWNLLSNLFPTAIRIPANRRSMFLCSVLSGVSSGLFGIGGPFTAGYFMTLFDDDHKAYIASLQIIFLINAVMTTSTRFLSGILTLNLLPAIFTGLAASLLGMFTGGKIADRMNVKRLKLYICFTIIFAGFVSLYGCLK